MMGDSGKAFDPIARFTELQSLMTGFFDPLKIMSGGPAGFMRYEMIDPQVMEIAILAAMHNMASMLKDPARLKAVINAELAERAKKLDAS